MASMLIQLTKCEQNERVLPGGKMLTEVIFITLFVLALTESRVYFDTPPYTQTRFLLSKVD
jgi:hypothetical protein